jgi:hypothetical protein
MSTLQRFEDDLQVGAIQPDVPEVRVTAPPVSPLVIAPGACSSRRYVESTVERLGLAA